MLTTPPPPPFPVRPTTAALVTQSVSPQAVEVWRTERTTRRLKEPALVVATAMADEDSPLVAEVCVGGGRGGEGVEG